jgi:hypothetical protein
MMMAGGVAHGEMWKCVDQEGNTHYTNVRSDAKGCKALNLEPINTAPTPSAPARQPAQKTANFPSVDADTQKQRDAGRRRILEQELALEQQLEAAKKLLGEQQETRLGNEKTTLGSRKGSGLIRRASSCTKATSRISRKRLRISGSRAFRSTGRLTRPGPRFRPLARFLLRPSPSLLEPWRSPH